MEGLVSSPYTDSLHLQETKGRRTMSKASSLKDRDLTAMSHKDARAIAQEFEAFFLSQVFEYMTKGLSTDGVFGGGHAEGIYRSMMNEEYGKAVAERGGYGIGDLIYRDILKLQSAQRAAKEVGVVQETEAEKGAKAYQALDVHKRHSSVKPEAFVPAHLEKKGTAHGT